MFNGALVLSAAFIGADCDFTLDIWNHQQRADHSLRPREAAGYCVFNLTLQLLAVSDYSANHHQRD